SHERRIFRDFTGSLQGFAWPERFRNEHCSDEIEFGIGELASRFEVRLQDIESRRRLRHGLQWERASPMRSIAGCLSRADCRGALLVINRPPLHCWRGLTGYHVSPRNALAHRDGMPKLDLICVRSAEINFLRQCDPEGAGALRVENLLLGVRSE